MSISSDILATRKWVLDQIDDIIADISAIVTSPKDFVVLKDTSTGQLYKLQITNGVLNTEETTDPGIQ